MSDPPQTFGSFSAEMIRDDFFGQNKYRPELSFVVRSKTMPFDDLTPGDLVTFDSNCGSVPCIYSPRYVQ
jgi:ribulose-5-phosphate 4-epimerase/fuculose-1-phosphate aldolase